MSNSVKIIIVLILVIAIGYFVFYKSQSSNIKIGAIFSLTGNGAAWGEAARDGMMLAVEKINSQGGINGKKIEAIYHDSQFDPKIGLDAYKNLQLRSVRYFFTNGSSVSTVIGKSVINDHNFDFETGAVTPLFSDGKSNTCRITLLAPVSGKALGTFIVNKLKARTVGFLTLNDEFGTAMRDNTTEAIITLGAKVVGQESFDKNASDFRTQILKLKSVKPDVVVFIPAAGQVESLLKQMHELALNSTLTSDNWTIINQNLKNLSLAEGIYFVNYDWQISESSLDSAQVREFKELFKRRYNYEPTVIAANAYDSLMLLGQGLKAVGSDNPEAVGNWLVGNIKNYQGITGRITLNQDCESPRNAVIDKVVNGQFILQN